jgi:hypothetical protein
LQQTIPALHPRDQLLTTGIWIGNLRNHAGINIGPKWEPDINFNVEYAINILSIVFESFTEATSLMLNGENAARVYENFPILFGFWHNL